MRHIIFFLFISTTVFAQTPRLKFRQIQKDTTQGSIAISNPADSQLVFSRDFYISYGVDTVLILYGDTVGVGATLDAEQVQDIVGAMVNAGLGLDVTYNDVDGELLLESLSIEDSVKNETLTTITKGTPLYAVTTVGNYWSVAPADATDPAKMPVVAIAGEDIVAGATGVGLIFGHIKGVNVPTSWSAGDEVWVGANGTFINHEPATEDTLIQRLGSVIKTGTNGSGIINIGDVNKNLNDGNIFIGDATGKVTTTQYIVDSTRINATGDTAFYYQNGLLIGSQEIAGGGGGGLWSSGATAGEIYYNGGNVGIGVADPDNLLDINQDVEVGTVTDIDGNVYQTIIIGDQVWLTENLRVTKYNTGTSIPNVTDGATWAGLTTGARSYYNNDSTQYDAVYGALYNWYTVQGDSLCPTGYHIPTDAEWTVLSNYLGGASIAGGKLKEVGTTHWLSPNSGATDEVGFTALPSGQRSSAGSFGGIGYSGYYWSATPVNSTFSNSTILTYASTAVSSSSYSNKTGIAVRCMKDIDKVTVDVEEFNVDNNTLYVDGTRNRVGIGTSSPSSILEINQNVNSSSTVTLKNINTGTSARIGHIFWNGTGPGDYFAFLLNGDNYNGISGWNDRFTVQSGTGVTNGLLFYSDLGGIQLSANGTNTPDLYVQDATGNVGIGTSSPSADFQVDADSAIAVDATNNRLHINGTYDYSFLSTLRAKIEINGTENSAAFRYKGGFVNETNDFGSVSKSTSTINKRIQYIFYDRDNVQTGKFGVDVKGLNDDDFQIVAGSGTTPQFSVEANGNVGIGTSSPAYKLDVNGDIRGDNIYSDNNNFAQTPSDIRLKKNITEYGSVINKLLQLNLVNWEWNEVRGNLLTGRDSKDEIMKTTASGLIAQQVEGIFPNLVGEDYTGYKTLSYVGFIVPLLKGFQEQQEIIETQEQKITDLETTIQSLITRIENLENK